MTILPAATVRPYFVKALLLSLAVAAAAGIFALLFGTFGAAEGRILATTLLVGIYSVICLCCMTVWDTRYVLWGVIGMAVSSVSLLLGLIIVWMDWDSGWEVLEPLLKYFAAFAIVGVSIGHQSLLLRIVDRAARPTQTLIVATVGIISLVATMLVVPILQEEFDLGEMYWRLLGVFAILDVLGTITTPVLARLSARRLRGDQ